MRGIMEHHHCLGSSLRNGPAAVWWNSNEAASCVDPNCQFPCETTPCRRCNDDNNRSPTIGIPCLAMGGAFARIGGRSRTRTCSRPIKPVLVVGLFHLR